mgnify:CR=1 FL=1
MKISIRKGDFVQVIKGKDRGKKGRVLRVYPDLSRTLVEGVNFVKKHTRPRSVDRQGGIIQMEKPLALGNVMFFCMKCEKTARVGRRSLQDGTKVRYCRKCNEIIEST